MTPDWFGLREKLLLRSLAALLPLLLVFTLNPPYRGALALVFGLLALAAIWAIWTRGLVLPLRHTAKMAGLLAGGDFTARAGFGASAPREFATLGTAIDAIAERLEQRERAVAAAQAETARSEREMRLLAENSSDIIVRLDATLRRRYVSPAVRTILGCTETAYLSRDLLSGVHADDLDRLRTLMARLDKTQTQDVTYRQQREDGRYVWLEAIWRRLDDGQGWVVVLRDVTRRRRTEDWINDANRRLRTLATQDGLTGLANRRHFDVMLEQEFARAKRDQKPLSLALIDVDHFKSFNDQYGHPAGDDCLRRVADIIQATLRSTGDVAARYGGEEIGVILPGASTQDAGQVAERIRAAVQALGVAHIGGKTGCVTVSVGVASLDEEYEVASVSELVTAADRALYIAKEAGRNQVQIAGGPLPA